MRTLHVAPGNLAEQMRSQGLQAEADLPMRSGIRNERAIADLFFGIHACAQTNDDRLKQDVDSASDSRCPRGTCCSSEKLVCMPGVAPRRSAFATTSKITCSTKFGSTTCRSSCQCRLTPSFAHSSGRLEFPPHRYHTQRRVDVARKLIRAGVPLASISHLLRICRPGASDACLQAHAWLYARPLRTLDPIAARTFQSEFGSSVRLDAEEG